MAQVDSQGNICSSKFSIKQPRKISIPLRKNVIESNYSSSQTPTTQIRLPLFQKNNQYIQSKNDLINIDNVQCYITQCFTAPGSTRRSNNLSKSVDKPKFLDQQLLSVGKSKEEQQNDYGNYQTNSQINEGDNSNLGSQMSTSGKNRKESFTHNMTAQFTQAARKTRRISSISNSKILEMINLQKQREQLSQINEQDDVVFRFEQLIKDQLFYQDLFKLGFNLDQILTDYGYQTVSQEEKMKLIQHMLDLLFKNEKLRHAFPPIKRQNFKKQNARRYNFKEKMDDAFDDSHTIMKLQELELQKKGILISESTKKVKRYSRPIIDKNLDVIQQNILKSRLT